MKIFSIQRFGDVMACELGWSPVGRPLMTVNCFIAGGVLIDSGQAHMQEPVLSLVAEHHIKAVLLTHHHEDHSGNAAAIKNRHHLPVLGHPLTVAKMQRPYPILPYQHLVWGATSPLEMEPLNGVFEHNRLEFTPIHTPGHSKDHTAFLETAHGWLFSGDLYLGGQIKYFRADEQIDDQIVSLKKMLSFEFDALFCAHRPRPKNGKRHLRDKLQYLEDLYGNVSRLAGQGMNEKSIMEELRLKEQWLVKTICFGNVSMKNMVRSVTAANERQGSPVP
ncbi:MAG: MBL fold metallo-hydrolase [Desulfobacteraceae bacterium]|nr:MAG: MBL fold metallo-hydrolase [Desulfobacteraceae bacterium]